MHIFLDESGDLGFNFENKKTSRFFVITCLVAQDLKPIQQAVDRTLKNKIRKKRKNKQDEELKGSKTNIDIKKYFYKQMRDYQGFYLSSVILDKYTLKKYKNINKADLYDFLAEFLLTKVNYSGNCPTVKFYIDKSKNAKEISAFNKAVLSALQECSKSKPSITIDHLDSKKNAGLQATDMFCHGIARKYEIKDQAWYSFYRDRIKEEILLSNKKDGPYYVLSPADQQVNRWKALLAGTQ